jgi:hypothetical protein
MKTMREGCGPLHGVTLLLLVRACRSYGGNGRSDSDSRGRYWGGKRAEHMHEVMLERNTITVMFACIVYR